jgi:hypothetical protein
MSPKKSNIETLNIAAQQAAAQLNQAKADLAAARAAHASAGSADRRALRDRADDLEGAAVDATRALDVAPKLCSQHSAQRKRQS